MPVITTAEDGELHHHQAQECLNCGEACLAPYCSDACLMAGEGVVRCDDCGAHIAPGHECDDPHGDHQRELTHIECRGCGGHPIGYRHRRRWVVSCEECEVLERDVTLAGAIEAFSDDYEPGLHEEHRGRIRVPGGCRPITWRDEEP
jgi:hypothetical protein